MPFQTKEDLREFLKPQVYKCKWCQIEFTDKYEINRHENMHLENERRERLAMKEARDKLKPSKELKRMLEKIIEK